eukprot:COSAG06_NODE_71312_length_185_cov_49.255814_1_plen_34_part_01
MNPPPQAAPVPSSAKPGGSKAGVYYWHGNTLEER